MRKPDKKEHINLLFSAFLVIAFIICANFFAKSIESMSVMAGRLVVAGVYIVFGVLLFFATRIGEGKPVKRSLYSVRDGSAVVLYHPCFAV